MMMIDFLSKKKSLVFWNIYIYIIIITIDLISIGSEEVLSGIFSYFLGVYLLVKDFGGLLIS